jgi:hypothetical protein
VHNGSQYKKVASYHWREPFATLMKATEISFGQGEATNLERSMAELVDWFIAHPDIGWQRQLRDAAVVNHVQGYRY